MLLPKVPVGSECEPLMPWLASTGQKLKFSVLAVAFAVCGFVTAWTSLRVGTHPELVRIDLCSTALGLALFVVLNLSIRCPSCKGHIFWWACSKLPQGKGLASFLALTDCPYCRFPSQQRPTTQ
jgi:hypothetical protein